MQKEVEKRRNLNFNNLENLSKEIDNEYNETFNGELCFTRYGMNHILRKYCGFDENYRIHALLEHGVILNEYVGGAFRVHEYLPSVVSSDYRVSVLKKEKNYKGAYAIGPYIHYSPFLLSDDKLKEEKERMGKTLLVFPTHSIEGLITEYDIEKFITHIKDLSSDYDTVRVCMYYKDITLGKHKEYQKNGFDVVTAGHFNDYYFLPRLKSIIELSDMTMSNSVGTHIGYCLYLNKPHYIFQSELVQKAELDDRNSKLMFDNGENLKKHSQDNFKYLNGLFQDFQENITKEQLKSVGYLWGFENIKSPKELRELILQINENYSSIKYYLSGLQRLKDIISGKR